MGKPRGSWIVTALYVLKKWSWSLMIFYRTLLLYIALVGPKYHSNVTWLLAKYVASTRLLKVDGCHGVGRSRQKVGLHLSWGEVLPVLPPSPPEWMHFSQRHVCMPSCKHSFCIFHESGSCVVKGLYLSNIRFAFVIAMGGLCLLAEGLQNHPRQWRNYATNILIWNITAAFRPFFLTAIKKSVLWCIKEGTRSVLVIPDESWVVIWGPSHDSLPSELWRTSLHDWVPHYEQKISWGCF